MKNNDPIVAGMNAEFDEQAAHLQNLNRLAREAGYTVGSNAPLPELNPDGSYANPEDDQPDAGEGDNTEK